MLFPRTNVHLRIPLVEEAGDEDIRGIGISASDYGANKFVEGRAVSSYLHAFTDPAIGGFGGFKNLAGPSLVESATGANVNRVQTAPSASVLGRGPGAPRRPGRTA